MKIRSTSDIQAALNEDFIWRKQELTTALFRIQQTKGKTHDFSIRSAILLLYAHWEGFIKNAASVYVEYVSFQGLPFESLANSFVAIGLKQKFSEFDATLKVTKHLEFIEYLDICATQVPRFNPENVIKTASNLNSVILKEILVGIGISYSPFELKANLIDEQLLNYRNTIAHGERLSINQKGYEDLHKEVFNMLKQIKDEIENAVVLKTYKKASVSPFPKI